MDAVTGNVLKQLSDKMLSCLGNLGDNLYNRDANFEELEDHIRTLEPLIVHIRTIRDSCEDPTAGDWLKRIRKAYDEVDRLRQSGTLQSSGSVKKVNEKFSKLLEDAKALQATFRLTSEQEEERWRTEWESSKPEVSFGGEAVVADVMKALIFGSYSWVVLSGKGGVGKTHLAREVFHDEDTQTHFTGGLFWVTVSKDKPETHVILKALCEQILRVKNIPDFPRDLKDAVTRVKGALRGMRIVLIVLDDVWHREIVKCFDGILEEDQGVILVTTRDQNCVRSVANISEFIDVPVLSEDDSWTLFSWYAFRKGRNHDPELEGVARELARECKGLPLALRVIGATMRDIQLLPDERRGGKTLQSEWQKILVRFQTQTSHGDDYKDLFSKLQVSMDSLLAEDARLFHCFCSFAAFPEDHMIEDDDLVATWVAAGMIGTRLRSWDSQIEDAKMLLDTLVHKCMIERRSARPLRWAFGPEETSVGSDTQHCIHDILRDLARYNLAWDLLAQQEIPLNKRECLYAPALMAPEFPLEWTAGFNSCEMLKEWVTPGTSNLLRTKRISLVASNLSQLPSKFWAPHLQVLLLQDVESLRVLPRGVFQQLSNVTLLNLSYTQIEEILDGVLRGLKSLRLLDLRGCERLRRISSEITNLQTLESVHLIGCEELESLPRVGTLTKLHSFSATLPRSGIACDGQYGWQRWSDYLAFCGLSKYAILELFLSCNLRRLILSRHGGTIAVDDRTEPMEPGIIPDVSHLSALDELTIWELLPPPSIVNLQNLKALTIQCLDEDFDFQNLMPSLDELPLLERLELRLWGMTALPTSFGREKSFPSLKGFELVTFKMKHIFTFCPGTMPNVRSIVLDASALLEFPKSMRNLRTLRNLTVYCNSHVHESGIIELISEEDSFPVLEELGLQFASPMENLGPLLSGLYLESLPSLRAFHSNVRREQLPSHLVDLEKQSRFKCFYYN